MKCFVDGDHVFVAHDNFIDLQKSPVVDMPLDSPLGRELVDYGVEGARPELALDFLVQQRLCLTPIMKSMWTSFPVGGWDAFGVKNTRHSLVEAVLAGAIALDEVEKHRHTGMRCLDCKGKVVRDLLRAKIACDCIERPLYVRAEEEPVSETVPEHAMMPKQWVAADLVLDAD